VQSVTVAALRDAVEAVSRTGDEMAKLFQVDEEADDIIEEGQ
jgi:hypothetical protein